MWGSFLGALKGIGSGLGKAGQWYDQKVGGGLNWLDDKTGGAGDDFVRSLADQYVPGAGAGLQGVQQKIRPDSLPLSNTQERIASAPTPQIPRSPQYAAPQQPSAPTMPLPPMVVPEGEQGQNPLGGLGQALSAGQQFGKGK